MTVGEIAFLAMVVGSLAVFAVAMIWLRRDYVSSRDRSRATTARAEMAE